jgi:hypothetical protein
VRFKGLFFGDFLLAPQKKTEGFGEAKVTPLPGGTPGTVAESQSSEHSTPHDTVIPRR